MGPPSSWEGRYGLLRCRDPGVHCPVGRWRTALACRGPRPSVRRIRNCPRADLPLSQGLGPLPTADVEPKKQHVVVDPPPDDLVDGHVPDCIAASCPVVQHVPEVGLGLREELSKDDDKAEGPADLGKPTRGTEAVHDEQGLIERRQQDNQHGCHPAIDVAAVPGEGHGHRVGQVVLQQLRARPAGRHRAPAEAHGQDHLHGVDAAEVELGHAEPGQVSAAGAVNEVEHHTLHEDCQVPKQDDPCDPCVRGRLQLDPIAGLALGGHVCAGAAP
mmetsp:Transcript_11081/g.25178  ORF Transcript_11081/g.25178 Transcript_11081/m.25178 type:complete len:273 (-) Transcript_11081:10-828(-)